MEGKDGAIAKSSGILSGIICPLMEAIPLSKAGARRPDAVGQADMVVKPLASMQGRDEENVISLLELVCLFPLELPVCIVDEHQDAWSAGGGAWANISRALQKSTAMEAEQWRQWRETMVTAGD
jgi:hypothetical protein